MQRIANCIVYDKTTDQVLLLQKPRRGWWVAPGGKMEPGETVIETVIREVKEETGIEIKNPQLRGVFSILIEEDQQVINEWMMFTFYTEEFTGELLECSPEGELSWLPVDKIAELPKAEGDQAYFQHVLLEKRQDVLVKRFRYTQDYELISAE